MRKQEFDYQTPGEMLLESLHAKLVEDGLAGYVLVGEMKQRLQAGVYRGMPGAQEALDIHLRQMKEWAQHLLAENIQRATYGDHPGA